MAGLDPSAVGTEPIAQLGLTDRFQRIRRARLRPRSLREAGQSFTLTFIAVVLLAAFLSPLLRSFTV